MAKQIGKLYNGLLLSDEKKRPIKLQRHGEAFKAYCYVKEANVKRPQTAGVQLYDILEKARL